MEAPGIAREVGQRAAAGLTVQPNTRAAVQIEHGTEANASDAAAAILQNRIQNVVVAGQRAGGRPEHVERYVTSNQYQRAGVIETGHRNDVPTDDPGIAVVDRARIDNRVIEGKVKTAIQRSDVVGGPAHIAVQRA